MNVSHNGSIHIESALENIQSAIEEEYEDWNESE